MQVKSIFNNNTVMTVQSEAYFGLIQKNILATLSSVGLEGMAYHPPEYNFFDQNFGFTLVCSQKCAKKDFDNLSVSVPNIIFQKNKLSDIFSIVPIPKYSFSDSEVNSIFHPTIFKLIGDVFIEHYLESRPASDILSQIKTSPEDIKKQLLKDFYILPDISI
jgi:hypothetical protein